MKSNNPSAPSRIAVAGATGRIGTALIEKLVTTSIDIVALTRNPERSSLPPTIERASVDFANSETLLQALEGADRLFLAQGTSAQQVENEIALIDAAVAAGVAHIVKISAMGPPSRLHPFDWHAKIEAHLATQELGYMVLRPSTFVDILASSAPAVAAGTWGGSAGLGRVNLVDTRDVAEASFATLFDERHVGAQRAFHLTGPTAVTMPDIAEELSRLLERKVTYEHRTPEEQRNYMVRAGSSTLAADLRIGLESIFKDSVLSETTNTLVELSGKEPRSVSTWLSDNLSIFKG